MTKECPFNGKRASLESWCASQIDTSTMCHSTMRVGVQKSLFFLARKKILWKRKNIRKGLEHPSPGAFSSRPKKLFKINISIINMVNDFYRQLGIGVASLTFGVALSIFIYTVASGIVNSLQEWLLFATSFLLMMRFWWRYSELFVQFLPSRTFWHFSFDFAISFFGILAVLSVGSIQNWAMLGALAMLSSAIRCSLSWNSAVREVRQKLKRTLLGAIGMFAVVAGIYVLAPLFDQILLAVSVFVIVLVFVIYSSVRY